MSKKTKKKISKIIDDYQFGISKSILKTLELVYNHPLKEMDYSSENNDDDEESNQNIIYENPILQEKNFSSNNSSSSFIERIKEIKKTYCINLSNQTLDKTNYISLFNKKENINYSCSNENYSNFINRKKSNCLKHDKITEINISFIGDYHKFLNYQFESKKFVMAFKIF
jgi:hypothetical protein